MTNIQLTPRNVRWVREYCFDPNTERFNDAVVSVMVSDLHCTRRFDLYDDAAFVLDSGGRHLTYVCPILGPLLHYRIHDVSDKNEIRTVVRRLVAELMSVHLKDKPLIFGM